MDSDAMPAAIELITGRWRGQMLFTGTSLGVFEALDRTKGRSAEELAESLDLDGPALYRLLRALSAIGLLAEDAEGRFTNTATGACFRTDHPASLRAMTLLEEGPVHYAIWKHLGDIVRSGKVDGFQREYGMAIWDYLKRDPGYARVFSQAMSSYSAGEAPLIRQVLRSESFGSSTLCDVGGGHGALLAAILGDHVKARGIVLDLPEVVATAEASTAVAGRIEFVGGDMFAQVPAADAYFLKHILHDWSDDDCLRILSTIHRAAGPASRLFICEVVVPGPAEPHFAKLLDVHMMVVLEGRQRTAAELDALLTRTGWQGTHLHALQGSPMSVLSAGMR